MGTVLASTIVARAAQIAQDEQGTGVGGVTWKESEGLDWLNEAQVQVADIRPDASVVTHSVQLVPGTRQSITGRRLMDILNNTGTNGLTEGASVSLVERGVQDEFLPGWRAATAVTAIKEWMFNAANPTEFDVSPPVHATTAVYVRMTEAINPAAIATIGSAITLDDAYQGALLEWVLHRYFSRDAEETSNRALAQSHLSVFYAALGKKLEGDMAINPELREQLK